MCAEAIFCPDFALCNTLLCVSEVHPWIFANKCQKYLVLTCSRCRRASVPPWGGWRRGPPHSTGPPPAPPPGSWSARAPCTLQHNITYTRSHGLHFPGHQPIVPWSASIFTPWPSDKFLASPKSISFNPKSEFWNNKKCIMYHCISQICYGTWKEG